MKVVIINGYPRQRSGKDTFVNFCKDILNDSEAVPKCYNLSTIDYVKSVAEKCGWNGEKDASSRKFLSDLKKALTEWRDLPFRDIQDKIHLITLAALRAQQWEETTVFIHCREPEEIKRLVTQYRGLTLLIKREDKESDKQSNSSDRDILNYNYDFVIENNGTLEDLRQKALVFLEQLARQ